MIATNVFSQPGKHIKLRLPTHAQWGGGPHVLLVLDSRMYKGKAWLRVALPDRPNGSSGWIREDFVRLSTTRWRITINREAHTRHRLPRRAQAAQLQGRDRQRRRRRRRAGSTRSTRSSPQPDPKGFLGPWALHLTAFSDVLLQLRRRARAASRSTVATARAWPIRSARRRRTAACASTTSNILWMARVIPLGTPVLIT